MLRFLHRLLLRVSGARERPHADAGVEYRGFLITPAPQKEPGGWRLAGTISKESDAGRRVYHLVRADTSPDREAIVAMTIAKAKRLIDDQGDRLFPGG
jgi:hypothetical protein